MKKRIGYKTILLILALIFFHPAFSQVAVNEDGSSPTASAMLEVKSTSKGFLPPRMTMVQRDGISSPAAGLVIYNTDVKGLNLFDGTKWTTLSDGFLCEFSQVVDAEGHIYNTVLIGDQCWMASNLNIGTRINVGAYPADNGTVEKYCYENNESNCNTYGALYGWAEAMQYVKTEGARGICPNGWHIPTHNDFLTLVNLYGGQTLAGGPLKETGTAHWAAPNTGATNESGFTALGAGWIVYQDGPGTQISYEWHVYTYFWGSCWTHEGSDFADVLKLHYYYAYAEIDGRQLEHIDGMSIRCVRSDPAD